MYENLKTTCRVKHENEISEFSMCTLGVKQGESLIIVSVFNVYK